MVGHATLQDDWRESRTRRVHDLEKVVACAGPYGQQDEQGFVEPPGSARFEPCSPGGGEKLVVSHVFTSSDIFRTSRTTPLNMRIAARTTGFNTATTSCSPSRT